MNEFQPPDPPEPDYDTMAEEMFDRYEKCGYAVISREEWAAKLDDAAKDGYAEGRKDEREESNKDAARYRWLRDHASDGDWRRIGEIPALSADIIDAEIDAAICELCVHIWKVTSQRPQGMWCVCEKCGEKKEETWD